jgi:pimeloyl-ACP methyl ester carboxylesterase
MDVDTSLLGTRTVEVDGLSVRYASSTVPGAPAIVLFSPWPESIFAYARLWPLLNDRFSLVAVDLPGFGQSQADPDLMSPRAMGDFVLRLLDRLSLEQPHAVGPDVGTAALLFAAAHAPGAFRSITVGGGAATFPLHIDGILKEIVDAPGTEVFREVDPAQVVYTVVGSIANYDVPPAVVEDYLQSYAGQRYADSTAYVLNYPADLEALSPLLPTLSTPVQIIVGRQDPYGLTQDAELLRRRLMHARLDVLEGGHNVWEEDPHAYAAVLAKWVAGSYLRV